MNILRTTELAPITPEHASVTENRAAWMILEQFNKPVLTAFSDRDPVTAGGAQIFIQRMPGAKSQPHLTIEGGGHFLQEDAPEQLSQLIDDLMRR